MTKIEHSYLAGVIDGEGYIGLVKYLSYKQYTYVPKLTVTNTCFSVLGRLQAAYGGKIYDVKHRSIPSHYKPLKRWVVTGAKCAEVLKVVQQYLFIKRNRARLVLLAYDRFLGKKYSRKTPMPDSERKRLDRCWWVLTCSKHWKRAS